LRAREPQLRGRSAAKLTVDPERAVGLLGKAIDHAQPEAAAFAELLGGEERLQDLFENFGRDSGAGVAHRQLDIVARRKFGPIAGRKLMIFR